MASFATQELFLRARDGYVASGRWTAIGVAALLAAHAALLAPAVEEERARRAAEREAGRLAAAAPEVAALGGDVEAATQRALAALEPLLGRFAEGVQDDLDRVAAAARALRRDTAAAATPTDAADAGAGAAGGADVAAGEPAVEVAPPGREVVPLAVDDPDRAYDVAHARGRAELLAALQPLVADAVVGPRFAALAEAWRRDVLPPLVTRLDAAAGRLPRLRARLPSADAELAALGEALGELRRVARELAFPPPEEAWWWASDDDDGRLRLAPSEAVLLRLADPLARDAVESAASEVTAAQAAVVRALDAARAAAAPPANGGGAAAGDGLAAVAPLLLAVALAALAAWRSSRIRELGLTAALMTAEGGPPSVASWFLAQGGLGGADGGATPDRARRRWRAATAAWAGGAVLWIGAAAAHAAVAGADRLRLAVAAGLALVAVIGAALHRRAAVRGALARFAERPAAERPMTAEPPAGGTAAGGAEAGEPTAGEPTAATATATGDRDAGFLDVQTLRR